MEASPDAPARPLSLSGPDRGGEMSSFNAHERTLPPDSDIMKTIILTVIFASCLLYYPTFGESAEDWYKQGAVAIDKHDFANAITYLDEAIRLNPKYALAYDDRAYAYELQGHFQKAID